MSDHCVDCWHPLSSHRLSGTRWCEYRETGSLDWCDCPRYRPPDSLDLWLAGEQARMSAVPQQEGLRT